MDETAGHGRERSACPRRPRLLASAGHTCAQGGGQARVSLQSSTVLTGVGFPSRSCVALGEGLSLDPSFLNCEVWIVLAALSELGRAAGGVGELLGLACRTRFRHVGSVLLSPSQPQRELGTGWRGPEGSGTGAGEVRVPQGQDVAGELWPGTPAPASGGSEVGVGKGIQQGHHPLPAAPSLARAWLWAVTQGRGLGPTPCVPRCQAPTWPTPFFSP